DCGQAPPLFWSQPLDCFDLPLEFALRSAFIGAAVDTELLKCSDNRFIRKVENRIAERPQLSERAFCKNAGEDRSLERSNFVVGLGKWLNGALDFLYFVSRVLGVSPPGGFNECHRDPSLFSRSAA